MADRSPNFPQISLREALDSIRLVYQREGRSKMPRLSAVKPLGYSSINGRSLGILGALRAYGLLDGRGDDVRVSDDAITILNAPSDSAERKEALVRAFENPPAFAVLRSKGDASPDTLRWHLIKANFRDDAADKLLKVYLDSKDLVNATVGPYDSNEVVEEEQQAADLLENDAALRAGFHGAVRQKPPSPVVAEEKVGMGGHERVLQSGMLSKNATYRVIVSGPVGLTEIERLIAKIEMDKEILAEPDPEQEVDDPDDI